MLAEETGYWESNYRVYRKQDDTTRLRFIRHIEKEAALGLPMAMELVGKVTLLRMTK